MDKQEVIIIKAFKNFLWVVCIQMMAGSIAIYIVDKVMALCGIEIYVGINVFTMLFTGIFGIPGVATLFVVVGIFKNIFF